MPLDEKKTLNILGAHGAGVVEFKEFTLILSSEQLVVLLLAEEGNASRSKIEKLKLLPAALQLSKAKLLLDSRTKFDVNLDWTAKKKAV